MTPPELTVVPKDHAPTANLIAANDGDDRVYRAIYECGSFADDWREFVAEVRGSPYSHALVALLTVIGWTVLLVLPLLIGAWS